MPSKQKIDQVSQIADNLKSAKSAALLQYQGLSAQQLTALRAKVKQAGGQIQVAKNTLITLALQKLGLKLPRKLTRPTAIAYGISDEIASLKEIDKVNQENQKTEFKYGIYNQKLLSLDELKQLLSLPSSTQLMAKFISSLTNPLARLTYALKYNQTRLTLVLKAISDQKIKN